MKIGLTYDLRAEYLAEGWDPLDAAEFDDEDTLEALEASLRRGGHEVVRIGHFRALAARLFAGERWDLVFNIAESYGGFGREALVPALLEAYRIPCTFSDSLVCAVTLQKAAAKRWVRDAGLATGGTSPSSSGPRTPRGSTCRSPCSRSPSRRGQARASTRTR